MSAFFNKEYELFYHTVTYLVSYHQNDRAIENYKIEIEKFTLEKNEKKLANAKEFYDYCVSKRNSDLEAFKSNQAVLKAKANKNIMQTLIDIDLLIRTNNYQK